MQILDKFVRSGAELEVNISSSCRSRTLAVAAEGRADAFTAAQQEVLKLMEVDR